MASEFEALISTHQNRIWAIARRYAQGDEQRDLYQEILEQLWKSCAGFRGDAEITTWLYRVAFNTAMTRLRSKARRISTVPEDPQTPDIASPGGLCQAEILEDFLASRGEVDRSVLMMYLDGLSGQQMADVLGLSLGAVQVRINRLKQDFSERYV